MSSQSYLDQAVEYYREREWSRRLLAARVPRNLVVKTGTLLTLGGASAVSQLLTACTQAASREADLSAPSAEGSYKYSKYPLIERYNWRSLPWGGTPYVDGRLQMQGSGVANWDFVRFANTSYGTIMDNLLNKRYGAGADMLKDELEGHIADRWTAARDYSYTDYHIRPGVYFHDLAPVNGRLCTAEDVKYCLDVYRTEGLARAALEFIDRVEVLPDRETVRVHLKRPVLFLDVTLASNDYWTFAREHREGDRARWEQQPIGTGPFKMTFQEVGARMDLVRHDRFGRRDDRWSGYQLPFLRQFNNFALPGGVTAKAALRSGQIDYSAVSDYVDLQDLLDTNPELVVQVAAPNTTYPPAPWALNLRDPILADVRVRRALSIAINRRQMIETLAGGLGSGSHPISYTWLGRSDPFSPEELGPWQEYNPERAKQLLSEAGSPNGFNLEYMVSGTPTNRDVMAQQMLEQVGVKVTFNQVEAVVLTAARTNRTFRQAISHTFQTGYDPVKVARDWFLPGSPRNWGGIDDQVMTDLVEKVTYTLDAGEQQRLLLQIHERALDQCYALEFYVGFAAWVRQPWLHNVASAVQGWFPNYGSHQVSVAWIDDKAPAERAGRLKA